MKSFQIEESSLREQSAKIKIQSNSTHLIEYSLLVINKANHSKCGDMPSFYWQQLLIQEITKKTSKSKQLRPAGGEEIKKEYKQEHKIYYFKKSLKLFHKNQNSIIQFQ